GDAVGQRLHVLQAGDGHAHLAHFALRHHVVGVVADLGGQVEGDREARLPLLQEEFVAAVGLLRVGEAGVLAHGPEAAAVHGGLDAAGEGELAGVAQALVVVPLRQVLRTVERLYLVAGLRLKAWLALLEALRRLGVGRLTPLLLGLAHSAPLPDSRSSGSSFGPRHGRCSHRFRTSYVASEYV